MRKLTDIAYGLHPAHKLDLYLPDEGAFDVFVYMHGGGLENGDKAWSDAFGEYVTARGVAVASINYRMYPTAVYPEFVRDSAAAVAWVKKHIGEYGDCRRVFVGGSSAGGYLSMMLCFDKRWLAPYKIDPAEIDGYIHDAGQPTCHFNVLRERGIDSRRVIIDDSAPLYHIGTAEKLAPMLFVVSDNDMENRYEQTKLVISTIKHFRYDMDKVQLREMHGRHCAYTHCTPECPESVLAHLICEYITGKAE